MRSGRHCAPVALRGRMRLGNFGVWRGLRQRGVWRIKSSFDYLRQCVGGLRQLLLSGPQYPHSGPSSYYSTASGSGM